MSDFSWHHFLICSHLIQSLDSKIFSFNSDSLCWTRRESQLCRGVGEYELGQRGASIGHGPANQLAEKVMLGLPSNRRVKSLLVCGGRAKRGRWRGRSTHSVQDGEIQRYTIGSLCSLGPQFWERFPLELEEQPWAWLCLGSELLQAYTNVHP